MVEIKQFESNSLSTFRTQHSYLRYGEFRTVEEFIEYRKWARERALPLFILANGSNTLFKRRKVRTLVLRNRLEPWMNVLDDERVEVSSSISVMRILRYCERHGLDSFYFLASVPATVGGAVAMNAGMAQETVLDFLESVTYLEGIHLVTKLNGALERGHRQTMFTGIQDRLIVSAVFRFPQRQFEESEIRKRIDWCHDHQDLSAPNCGSVFRDCNRNIMKRVRWLVPWGIRFPLFRAQFSRKVNNWIICRNKHSWPIVLLIRAVQLIHWLLGKCARTEVIEVD